MVRERPELVFCQNPSLILSFLCVLLRPFFKYKLIIDRHSSFKFETRRSNSMFYRVFHKISDYTVAKADITIITNKVLSEFVKICGGCPFILPDPLPFFGESKLKEGGNYFVFVSSMGEDENLDQAISAFKRMPEENLYITGNYKKAVLSGDIYLCDLPENIKLTGFLSDDDYLSLISGSKGMIVFTSNDYTLTCGAYEAVSLKKPMILSNTETMKSLFSKGAVYVSGDSLSFIAGVKEFQESENTLLREVSEFNTSYKLKWREWAAELERKLI